MSIRSLSKYFADRKRESEEEQAADRQKSILLATAAILLEVAYADSSISTAEEQKLVAHLCSAFQLGEESARELLETAQELRDLSVDHWSVTNTVRTSTSLADRIEIVKTMWRIVYVDGQMHQYENYLVRKLADLLGLEHHVMIEAKMAVHAELRGA
jgi:uncharacterized tellurite resistance protein B-like protein